MIHSDICTSCLRLDYFWNTFNPCPNSVRPFTLCKLMSPWWKSCSGEGFFHSWESLTNDLDSWLRLNLCNLGTDVNCCLSSQARIAHWEQGLGNLTARLTGLSWGHWCLTVCSSWLDPTFLGFGGWHRFPNMEWCAGRVKTNNLQCLRKLVVLHWWNLNAHRLQNNSWDCYGLLILHKICMVQPSSRLNVAKNLKCMIDLSQFLWLGVRETPMVSWLIKQLRWDWTRLTEEQWKKNDMLINCN